MSDDQNETAGPGHNSVAAGELRALIERVERLLDEKQTIADDIKEVKAEAKSRGFDMKAFNEMLRLRKLDKDERDEQEALREMYGKALGVFA